MHLGETLPPWNSKDKKCCLYKTPYVTAPMRLVGDIIAKAMPYKHIPLAAPTRTRKFSWFTSDEYLKRSVLSYQDSYVKFLQGDLQAKVIPERTTYCAWRDPQQVPSSITSRNLRSDMASGAQPSKISKIKMAAKKGRWVISPDSCASHPLRFAVGYYSRSKIWRPLVMTLMHMPTGKGTLRNLL